MVMYRPASKPRRVWLALCFAMAGIAQLSVADSSSPVIMNVPAGANVPGEGVEAPYLHGVPQNGQAHTRPEDIRPPEPFGTHPESFDTEARTPRASPSQELPGIDSSVRRTPMRGGAPSSTR